MDYKKLSKIADADISFGVGKSGSFEDFRKAVGNNLSSSKAFNYVRNVLSKDLLDRAKTKVLTWSGSDRPGENVACGPASLFFEVFLASDPSMDDLMEMFEDEDELFDLLEIDEEDDWDALRVDELTKEQIAAIKENLNPEGSGEYALVIKDWNDTGETVFCGLCSADELVDQLIGGEGHSYGYSECPWGLYQSALLCGLNPNDFIYCNTNDEFPEFTKQKVSEEVTKKVWDLSNSEKFSHFYSWDDDWNPKV